MMQTLQIQHSGELVVGRVRDGKFQEQKPASKDSRLKIMPGGTVSWVQVPDGYPLTIAVKYIGIKSGDGYNVIYEPS